MSTLLSTSFDTVPVSLSTRRWGLVHAGLIIALLLAAPFVRALHVWPLFWITALAAYFLALLLIPPLRATFQPWRVGRFTPFTIGATVVISVVASATLLWFQWYAAPKPSALLHLLPHRVLGSVLLAGITFSVVNALMEELVFRGVLYDGVSARWGAWTSIILISILFGFGHVEGYPPGPLGAVLAGIYSLALCWLRYVSGGLALPFLSHIVADATIFGIILGWRPS